MAIVTEGLLSIKESGPITEHNFVCLCDGGMSFFFINGMPARTSSAIFLHTNPWNLKIKLPHVNSIIVSPTILRGDWQSAWNAPCKALVILAFRDKVTLSLIRSILAPQSTVILKEWWFWKTLNQGEDATWTRCMRPT